MLDNNLEISLDEDFNYSKMSSSEMTFKFWTKKLYIVCYNLDKLIDNDTGWWCLFFIQISVYHNHNIYHTYYDRKIIVSLQFNKLIFNKFTFLIRKLMFTKLLTALSLKK